jgi:hypothetical protein
MRLAVNARGFAWEIRSPRARKTLLPRIAARALGLAALLGLVLLAALGRPEVARADGSRHAVQFRACDGWGLCRFARTAEGEAHPADAASASLRVRLRGVGDPALEGVCRPEGDAARTIRRFVEGILGRAGRIELDGIESRPDGSLLATVRVDGTDVADILVHIGLGREKPLPPGATWCD